MSRTRKAVVLAGFSYTQFGLSIVTGILLIPLVLGQLGARSYGLWLATGELLGYAAMVDLGVFGVFPWMLAEADGRQDRAEMRRLVGHGLLIGALVGLVYAAIAAGLWAVLPGLLKAGPLDRASLGGPLTLLVVAVAVSYPLRVFRAVLGGVQDVAFNGALSLLHSTLSAVVTVVLLLKGYGLYALALGTAVPAVVVPLVALARTATIAPDLLRGFGRPRWAFARTLLSGGIGVWLGAFGWQLLAASNAIVIASLGHPEWVPVYNCTAKVSVMLLQLGWVLPDSGFVGLAQLHGGGNRERVTEVVDAMMRLYLLLAGAAACAMLAVNPSFVRFWVGDQFFGGLTFNGWLAAGILVSSVTHGLICTASVLGNRFAVGVVTLVNGVVQLGCALAMGAVWGLSGVAAASVVAALVTAFPVGIRLLGPATVLNLRWMVHDIAVPFALRAAPSILAALAIGLVHRVLGLWMSILVGIPVGALYLWQTRRFYQRLLLEPWVASRLARFKPLLPSPLAMASADRG